MSITPEQLAQWEALCKAATEGPWNVFTPRRDTEVHGVSHEIRFGPHRRHQALPCDECGGNHVNGADRFNVAEIKRPRIRYHGCGKQAAAEAFSACASDASFIAAARTALPLLLAEHRRLVAENSGLRDALRDPVGNVADWVECLVIGTVPTRYLTKIADMIRRGGMNPALVKTADHIAWLVARVAELEAEVHSCECDEC